MNYKQLGTLTVIGSCALLGGCSTLSLLSLAASGVSYVVTGKSMSDHVISALRAEDCALHRMLDGRAPCNDWPISDGMALAGNTPAVPLKIEEDEVPAMLAVPESTLVAINRQVARETAPSAGNALPDPVNDAGRTVVLTAEQDEPVIAALDMDYVSEVEIAPESPVAFRVVGSFGELGNARARQNQLAALNAELVINESTTAARYRVVVNPNQSAYLDWLASNQQDFGLSRAWVLPLCPSTLQAPPCTAHRADNANPIDQLAMH